METTTSSTINYLRKDSSLHRLMLELLEKADIRVGGDRPWDMQINGPGLPERIFSQGSLGLGEAYTDGLWDVPQLDEFFHRLLKARLDRQVKPLRLLFHTWLPRLVNLQTFKRSLHVCNLHYNLNNDFFAAMLDSRMTYTCGYWRSAKTLDEAQEAKLDLICRKLKLQPGMRLLDFGCGWGSLMGFAAERYGVECTGVNISKEQIKWAKARYAGWPLEFRLQDYRETTGRFDRVVSVGMLDHVGRKNMRTFMEVAHRCLKDDGLFLLHSTATSGRNNMRDPWIGKYVFPNLDVPSAGQIGDAVDNLFVIEDLHNFGADYCPTLMAWHKNFEHAWPRFSDKLGKEFSRMFGKDFYRMWRYYLLSCAGASRARDIQLWQWVLSKEGVPGGYERITT
nr:cyclopropane fatty acyl phospholipid synthase [Xylella taiwanensis]